MKRVFISIPMRDKTGKQIKEDLEKVKRKVIDRFDDVEFIDNYFPEDQQGSPVMMLGKSIMLMSDADLIFFADGWESARGCRIEHEVAMAYEKEVAYE